MKVSLITGLRFVERKMPPQGKPMRILQQQISEGDSDGSWEEMQAKWEDVPMVGEKDAK